MGEIRTKERPKNSELGNVLFIKIDYPPLHPTIRLALDSLPSRVSRFPLYRAQPDLPTPASIASDLQAQPI